MLTLIQVAEASSTMLMNGGISIVASTIRYLWEFSKGQPFKVSKLFAYALAGLMMGNFFHLLLTDMKPEHRQSAMWIVGFLSFHLLDLLEKKGIDLIDKYGLLKR